MGWLCSSWLIPRHGVLHSARVNGLKQTVAWLLLALWVPVTSHCPLETVLDHEVLSCCSHETETPPVPHHEDDCATDSCATLEAGLFKTEDSQPLVTTVALGLPVPLPEPLDLVQNDFSLAPHHCTAPPELPGIWQFLLRAAPSPRAPSCLV